MFVHKSYEIPLYQGSRKSRFHIVVSDEKNWYKTSKVIQDYDDEYHEIFPHHAVAGFATYTESKKHAFHVWAVFTKERICHNTIAHEAVHVLNFIYKSRGIMLDLSNDEPQAYLSGWISEKIYETIPNNLRIR